MAAALCCGLLDYKTEKFALTRNRRVGLLHRLLQLAVLGYLLGWVLVVRRGYQDTDAAPHVSVITKMKGVSVTRSKDASSRLWDVVDYASPPQGENVVFLVTNFIATAKQAQGTCPELLQILPACLRSLASLHEPRHVTEQSSQDHLRPEGRGTRAVGSSAAVWAS